MVVSSFVKLRDLLPLVGKPLNYYNYYNDYIVIIGTPDIQAWWFLRKGMGNWEILAFKPSYTQSDCWAIKVSIIPDSQLFCRV